MRRLEERDPEDTQTIVDWYVEEGWSIRRIAKEVGVNACTISQMFRRLGVEIGTGPTGGAVAKLDRMDRGDNGRFKALVVI